MSVRMSDARLLLSSATKPNHVFEPVRRSLTILDRSTMFPSRWDVPKAPPKDQADSGSADPEYETGTARRHHAYYFPDGDVELQVRTL